MGPIIMRKGKGKAAQWQQPYFLHSTTGFDSQQFSSKLYLELLTSVQIVDSIQALPPLPKNTPRPSN